MSDQFSGTSLALVLDDDADTRFAIARILGKCGCAVLEAESVEEALALIASTNIDVVFSDMRIPAAAGGEELLDTLQEENNDVAVVLMSCAMDAASRTRLMNKGAFDCVQKPFFKETCEMILSNLSLPIQKSA